VNDAATGDIIINVPPTDRHARTTRLRGGGGGGGGDGGDENRARRSIIKKTIVGFDVRTMAMICRARLGRRQTAGVLPDTETTGQSGRFIY